LPVATRAYGSTRIETADSSGRHHRRVSPDVEVALDAMTSVGMTGVELRTIGGKNIVDLSDGDVGTIVAAAKARDMEIVSIASPLLKCVLPDGRLSTTVSSRTFSDRHSRSKISRA
jgi:hypothetical protein